MNIRNISGNTTFFYTVFMFPFIAHEKDLIGTVHTGVCMNTHTKNSFVGQKL
jgi:hypothetical protein